MCLRHHVGGKGRTLHRAHQTHAPFDFAIVGHHAARGNLNRRAPRLAVDEEKRFGRPREFERLLERQGLGSIALAKSQQFRPRGGDGMGEDRPAVRDDEAVGLQGLEAEIVSPRRNGPVDARGEQLLEGGEENVLQFNRQREQPIEKRRDRRQLVLEPTGVGEFEAGGVLEGAERAILDFPGVEQAIKLAQGVVGIEAFEIVLGTKEPLPSGLALSPGDRAQRIEPPRDGGEKALLGLHIGRDGTEQRRLRLVGAVGAPQTLDRGVGLPARLEEVVDTQATIPRPEVGVIGAAGAAGV